MRSRIGLVVLLVCSGMVGMFLLAGAGPTWASTGGSGPLTVNSTADFGDSTPGDGTCETASGNSVCTLRAALQEAGAQPGADTITFSVTGTINLFTPLPTITHSLTISGPGPTALAVVAGYVQMAGVLTISGTNDAQYSIMGLDFRGQNTHSGLSINAGSLTLNQMRFYQAGTALLLLETNVQASIHATVSNSTFESNNAPGGGAIWNLNADLLVTDSTFKNNFSAFGGGALNNNGTTTLRNSVFKDNGTGSGIVGGSGGAIQNNANSHLSLSNSTVSGNNTLSNGSSSGGGLYNAGTLTLTSATVTSNTTPTGLGGGLRVVTGSVTLLRNTILANSLQGGDCLNNNGTIIDGGYNLVEDNSCGFSGGADPLLAALADNGGPTLTHALLAGSPAIDAGNPAGCNDPAGAPLAYDQRGYLRSVDGNADLTARCDIGAFEHLSQFINLSFKLFLPLVLR